MAEGCFLARDVSSAFVCGFVNRSFSSSMNGLPSIWMLSSSASARYFEKELLPDP